MGKSTDRFATRRLSHLLKEAARVHALVPRRGSGVGPDEASNPKRHLLLPRRASANGSLSLGSIRPFWRPSFGYSPPSAMPQRDVSASQAPEHFLLVSWAGRKSNTRSGFNRIAGVNKPWGAGSSPAAPTNPAPQGIACIDVIASLTYPARPERPSQVSSASRARDARFNLLRSRFTAETLAPSSSQA